MEFIDKNINEELNREIERHAFEMATSRAEAINDLRNIRNHYTEHFCYCLLGYDLDTYSGWRGEVCGWISDSVMTVLKLNGKRKFIDSKLLNEYLFLTKLETADEISCRCAIYARRYPDLHDINALDYEVIETEYKRFISELITARGEDVSKKDDAFIYELWDKFISTLIDKKAI